MIIVFVADSNYTEYLAQSVKSYKKFNPSARIIVVSESPVDTDVENIIIKMERQDFRFRDKNERLNRTAYLKLFLTRLPFNKVLYVDADTICQAPLNELWDIPTKYISICESHSYGKKQAEALGLEKYGLAGMMLMNLKELRKFNFTEKCLQVMDTLPTPTTGWQHDETCMNVVLKGKLNFVDNKWDYCHKRIYPNPIREQDAKILHYIGKEKDDILNLPFYKSTSYLLEYIKGKDVAIVGNAKSLFNKNYGKEIDSHQVIIRFNKGFIIKKESQGTKTDILLLACEISKEDRDSYNARYIVNRSKNYHNSSDLRISQMDRRLLADKLGSQPSSGFMAIDLCLTANAKSITLYGFDGELSPTFYNPDGYVTRHDYTKEQEILKEYEKSGLLTVKE